MDDVQAAKEIVNRYLRRVWWISPEDLVQEAWLVLLEAREKRVSTFTESEYLHMVKTMVGKHLRNFLWKQSSPATIPQKPSRELVQNEIRHHRRVAMEASQEPQPARPTGEANAATTQKLHEVVGEPSRPDRLYAQEQWCHRVRQRVAQIVTRHCGPTMAEAARRVLLEEERPADVADAMGLPREEVYDARRWLVRLAKTDREMIDLAQQMHIDSRREGRHARN